ncbi:autotransporter assembly complex protein TamA [Rhodohalobacter sulfatireducens]|uniref:BamA/TamA family outer membrane protein n=1 Tax=Rhodohalobacter sulfatireducens TaxID=2911366 RepID=A0ABS9KCE1_9BACT|nr:BamA/TamA family outer membrane protein [Rhodohalobacter sulfatireducens]MCG2588498.1 BamA/TamA family outer membrane protein [Rhodohalobacter sulfatireducens]
MLSYLKKNTITAGKVTILWLMVFITVNDLYAFQQEEAPERSPVVWSVEIEGNETYRNIVLMNAIANESPSLVQKIFKRFDNFLYTENEVRRDQIRLRRYYERRGFHNVEVDYHVTEGDKEWKKNILFTVIEGVPLSIHSTEVNIQADSSISREIRETRDFERAISRHQYREGRRFEPIRQPDVEGAFLQALGNLGYAWPEIEIQTAVDSLAGLVDVKIRITPNSKTYFREFQVEGELSIPKRMLLRQSGLREGDLYTRDEIQNAQRNIFNHHLFRFATITLPEQEYDSTLSTLIRVREFEPRTIEASVGVGMEEIIRGQAQWEHRNINGRGHRYSANARASFIEQRLSSDYLVPYIFNSKSRNVTSLFGLHRLEEAFELFQVGLNSSLIYQIDRNKTASLSYEYSLNEELSRDQQVDLPDTVLSYDKSSFVLSGYYSEGYSRGQRGWVLQPSIELSGTFGESTFKFQKLNLDVRKYTQITNSLTLANRVNGGVIFYTQPDSLPSNIRYYSGGTNSVRGWGRQNLGPKAPAFTENGAFDSFIPLGGRATFLFNIELRQTLDRIIPNFGVAAFLDGGQVWQNIASLPSRPLQFGAGGGFRYQSPIGPVRVDIAYKLNPTEEDLRIYNGWDYGSAWDRIGIHFSIGQAF